MLPGKRHQSDCRANGSLPRLGSPSLAPAFAFQELHVGSCWLALHPRPAPHPPFPSFLPWLQGQGWAHGPQAQTSAQGFTARFPQCPSQPTCAYESFIFHSQPLPLQTCFPVSRHHCSHSSSIGSALHRHFALVLSLAVTPVESTSLVHVANHHSDSLRPR